MIVPNTASTGSARMIPAPIAARIVGGHHIGRCNGEIGQVRTPLPFQDHEGVRKPRVVEQSIQAIHGENTHSPPFGGKILLTPAGDIVFDLMVGMKWVVGGGCWLCRVQTANHARSGSDDRRAFGLPRIIGRRSCPLATSI